MCVCACVRVCVCARVRECACGRLFIRLMPYIISRCFAPWELNGQAQVYDISEVKKLLKFSSSVDYEC